MLDVVGEEMSTITADPNMLSVLSQIKGVTEIRDANGNLLGLFTPSSLEEKELYEKAKLLIDPGEIEKRKRAEGDQGSSLDEVWKRIHAKEVEV